MIFAVNTTFLKVEVLQLYKRRKSNMKKRMIALMVMGVMVIGGGVKAQAGRWVSYTRLSDKYY